MLPILSNQGYICWKDYTLWYILGFEHIPYVKLWLGVQLCYEGGQSTSPLSPDACKQIFSSEEIELSWSSHPHFFPSICIAFTLHACLLEKSDVAFLTNSFGKTGTARKQTEFLKKCRNPKTMLRIMDFLTSVNTEKYWARCKSSNSTIIWFSTIPNGDTKLVAKSYIDSKPL